jgi:hypothetical protein
MIKLIMLKVFATIVTISTAEQKSHGTVHMRSYMQEECVKTVTLTCTTKKSVNKIKASNKNYNYHIKQNKYQ